MPAVQTTYPENIAPAFAGMVANQEPSSRISRINGDGGAVAFGRAVFRGTASNECTGTPADDRFLGITIADIVQDQDNYPSKRNVGILEKGVIWVVNGADAVTHGQPVYVTPAGAFTNDDDAANVKLHGVEFDSNAAAAALVRLRVGKPQTTPAAA